MKESWWTMADLTELNFFSKQDFFDLTKEMSSCAAQLLKKYFKNKKARLEVSQPEDGLLSGSQRIIRRLIVAAANRLQSQKRHALQGSHFVRGLLHRSKPAPHAVRCVCTSACPKLALSPAPPISTHRRTYVPQKSRKARSPKSACPARTPRR